MSSANQNKPLSWCLPELSIRGAGQEDRSSGYENGDPPDPHGFQPFRARALICNWVCYVIIAHPMNGFSALSMPAKKRKHLKSGVQAETPLNCSNHDNVLTVDNNVSQIKGSKSNFSKGNICSNKVGLEKFSEPKVTRKREGLDLDVTTTKKAKLCSTINTSNHSEIENNIPVHSQGIALQNLNKFHNSLKCTIYHCQICQEAWPLKTKPKNYPNYICSRCSRDKCVPKKFTNERLYSKSIS